MSIFVLKSANIPRYRALTNLGSRSMIMAAGMPYFENISISGCTYCSANYCFVPTAKATFLENLQVAVRHMLKPLSSGMSMKSIVTVWNGTGVVRIG